jgi:hypothetical protein
VGKKEKRAEEEEREERGEKRDERRDTGKEIGRGEGGGGGGGGRGLRGGEYKKWQGEIPRRRVYAGEWKYKKAKKEITIVQELQEVCSFM